MSVVDEDAEWKTKHVSFFGAAKSFVTQLSIGQDLTRVSLPSVFLYPYSALELGGARSLHYWSLLQEAKAEPDPVNRMLKVFAYYVAQTKKEAFEKKPSNSILGENHYCWIENKNGSVHYLGEQVSHHPPISAYMAHSKADDIKVLCNFESEGVKFHGNSLGITLQGFVKVYLGDEEYTTSKPYPNIWIRNVILGTKRESWDGLVTITCPQTKVTASFVYKEEGWACTNVINGTISQDTNGVSTSVLSLTGAVSQKIYTYKFGAIPNENGNEDEKPKLLVDFTTLVPNKIHYLPENQWHEKSSLRIWKDMYKAILADDMQKSDAAKKIVEDEQRVRRKEGKNFEPYYFKFNEEKKCWDFVERDIEAEFPRSDSNSTNTTPVENK